MTAPRALSPEEVTLLRVPGRSGVDVRRGSEPAGTDGLVARGLARSEWVGHAGMRLVLTDAGVAALVALATLDPPTHSVDAAPAFMAEVRAFVERWRAAVGRDLPAFRRNLAYLVGLAEETAARQERERLRERIGRLANEDQADQATAVAALDAPGDPPRRPTPGTSSQPPTR